MYSYKKLSNQYKILFEANPVPMWVYDDDTLQILDVNESALSKYGYSKEEFLKFTIKEIRPVEDIPFLLESHFKARNQSQRDGTFRHKRKDGYIFDVEIKTSRLNFNGRKAWMLAAYDVTAKRKNEKYLNLQYSVSKLIADEVDFDETIYKILESIAYVEHWALAEFWYTTNEEKLKLNSFWGDSAILPESFLTNKNEVKLNKGECAPGIVWEKNDLFFTHEADEQNNICYGKVARKFDLKTFYGFPVFVNNQVEGVLCFYSKSKHMLEEEIILLYKSFCKQLGEFIHRHIQKESFLQNQMRLAGIVESAMDAIITIDTNQNILLFNSSAEKMFQYHHDEIIGKSLNILIPESFRAAHDTHVKKFGETGVTNRKMGSLGKIKGLRKNGEEFPIEASISQITTAKEKLYTVILRDISERQKAEEHISSSLREKEVLLKEIHHRVKNNLQIISSLLSLQSYYIEDNQILNIFRESQHRVKTMALIHEKLYSSSMLSQVSFKEYVSELLEYLIDSYDFRESDVKLILDIEDIDVSLDLVVSLGLILNELISNALKYAFPDQKEKMVKVSFYLDENNNYHLVFRDNGIGFREDFDFKNLNTLGLQLIFNLVDQISGTVDFKNDNGTKVLIEFPQQKKEK